MLFRSPTAFPVEAGLTKTAGDPDRTGMICATRAEDDPTQTGNRAHPVCVVGLVTTGLNFTQIHRFEFAVAAAAGAVD